MNRVSASILLVLLAAPLVRADILVWEHHIPDLVYTSCGIGQDGYYGGTTEGEPAVVECLGADGMPIWTWQGSSNSVHRGAVVEDNAGIDGVTVRFGGDGIDWAWSHDVPDCSAYDRCIRYSELGGLVAVALNMHNGDSAVICLDAGTGSPISTFVPEDSQFTRALRLTDDGTLAALRDGNAIYVIETATGTSIWEGDVGASADALAFSPDGRWLASGWSSIYVWERVGGSYEFRWSYNGGGNTWYLNTCAVDEDGDLVAGYYRSNWRQTKVQMVDANVGGAGVIYLGAESDGARQELPSASFIHGPSNLVVLGNWGDAAGLSPEILLFRHGELTPVASLDTPGSIFDIDAVWTIGGEGGGLEIVACGKAGHANDPSGGGSYYNLFHMVTGAPAGAAGDRLRIAAHPNPFNPATTLSVVLSAPGPLHVDLFDARGRRVRRLDGGEQPAGATSLRWDGRDDAGHALPSGLYLARATSGAEAASTRLMLLK